VAEELHSFLTSALDGVSNQLHDPAPLTYITHKHVIIIIIIIIICQQYQRTEAAGTLQRTFSNKSATHLENTAK
jgi:hypothetical protein